MLGVLIIFLLKESGAILVFLAFTICTIRMGQVI